MQFNLVWPFTVYLMTFFEEYPLSYFAVTFLVNDKAAFRFVVKVITVRKALDKIM